MGSVRLASKARADVVVPTASSATRGARAGTAPGDTAALAECHRAIDALRAGTQRLVRRQNKVVRQARADLEHVVALDFLISKLQRAIASDLSGHVGAIAHEAIRRALRKRRA
jgi:hypothetical protein